MKTEEKGLLNILVICMAVVFIGMSALMIFVPGVEIVYLCYAVCTAAVISGIYLIVRYFMTDAFRNVNAYGFSGGTLLVILAICGFLRAEAMAEAFVTILGIILLLSGVIVLQHSLDLKRLGDPMWLPVIVVSLIILICSMLVILQPMADMLQYDTYVWWMMLVAGALSLIINIYTMIRVSLFKKKEKKDAEAREAEAKGAETLPEPALPEKPEEMQEAVNDPEADSTQSVEEEKTNGEI